MRCIQVVWLMMTVFRRMGLGVKPGPSAVPAEAGHSRCTEEYMEVSVSQKLRLDQVANSSQWSLEVHDGRRTRTLTLSQARAQGYELSTGKRQTVIRAYYSAKGLRVFSRPQKKKSLYLADLLLRCNLGYTKLQMPILFLCVPEPVTCRETDIRIEVPAFNGTFLSMAVEDRTYLASRKHPDVQVQRLWDTLRLTVPASSPLVRRRMVKVQLFLWTLPLELVLVGTICMVHLLLHLWVGR